MTSCYGCGHTIKDEPVLFYGIGYGLKMQPFHKLCYDNFKAKRERGEKYVCYGEWHSKKFA